MTTYHDLRVKCSFSGTINQLKKVVRDYHGYAESLKLQNCYRIECDSGESLYWWDKTGAITCVEDRRYLADRTSAINWRALRTPKMNRGQSRWTKFDVNAHRSVSLPQLVFSDPELFFRDFAIAGARQKPPCWAEFAEIMDKVSAIKVADVDGETTVIENVFGVDGTFQRFQRSRIKQRRREARANVIQMAWVDLSAGAGNIDWSWGATPAFAKAVKSFVELVNMPQLMAGRGEACEAFFDDESKFVELTNSDIAGVWRRLKKNSHV